MVRDGDVNSGLHDICTVINAAVPASSKWLLRPSAFSNDSKGGRKSVGNIDMFH